MESKSRKTDRYKTKTCPTCNKSHKKRGPYCCRSCGNSRTFTPKQRKAISKQRIEHLNSPEALEERNRIAEQGKLSMAKIRNPDDPDIQAMTLDDVYVPPLTLNTDHNQFVAGGDLWTEVD